MPAFALPYRVLTFTLTLTLTLNLTASVLYCSVRVYCTHRVESGLIACLLALDCRSSQVRLGEDIRFRGVHLREFCKPLRSHAHWFYGVYECMPCLPCPSSPTLLRIPSPRVGVECQRVPMPSFDCVTPTLGGRSEGNSTSWVWDREG